MSTCCITLASTSVSLFFDHNIDRSIVSNVFAYADQLQATSRSVAIGHSPRPAQARYLAGSTTAHAHVSTWPGPQLTIAIATMHASHRARPAIAIFLDRAAFG